MNFLDDPLFQLLFNTPVPQIILKVNAPYFTIVIYNDACKTAYPKARINIAGKSLWAIFRAEDFGNINNEIVTDAFLKAINTRQKVVLSGLRYNTPKESQNGNRVNWRQLQITPVVGQDETVTYLFLQDESLTESVNVSKTIEEGLKREQLLNEELASFNEELSVSNEELLGSQVALRTLNNELEQRVARRTNALAESESRFRSLVQQAPIGIAIYSGPEFIIELANEKILEIWGRTSTIIGKPLFIGRPEIMNHSYKEVIANVFKFGDIHSAYEVKGSVLRNGKLKDGYFDVIYQPLKNNNGIITGVIAVLADVTEKVEARKAIERAEEMMRLAVEAAKLGTWYIDAETNEFVPSLQLKELMGYEPDKAMPFVAITNQIDAAYYDQVTTAMEEAIAGGKVYDLEYPLISHQNQEIRWVKATGGFFNTGLGKLAYLSGTMIDITERRQDDQRKNDFISMVSHELKTPLTSLKAYIQILQVRAAKDSDIFRINTLGKVEVQMNKMHRMINGFLNVAALESGKMQLVKKPFNLDDIIQEMVDDAILTNPRYVFNFLTCEPLPVVADIDKIGQIITNLLNNAVKYSPDGGEITISCHIKHKEAHVHIKDKGIGIKKQDLPNLFERFYRVQSEAMKSFSGFGIGLYLCAEIVKRHGGKIWAESEEGDGSTFYFTVPLEQG